MKNWLTRTLSKLKKHEQLVRFIVFVFIVAPVLLIALFSYVEIKQDLTKIEFSRRESIAQLSAKLVKEKFDRINDISISLSTRLIFRKLIREGKWEEAIKILADTPDYFPFIDRIFLSDTTGIIMAEEPVIPGIIGENAASGDWFRGASANWQPYLSEVYKRKAEPRYNVVAMATPIKDESQKVLGVLVMQIRLEVLLEWIENIRVGNEGSIYIVDQKGNVAANADNLSLEEIVDYSSVPVVQKVLRGESGVEILHNPVEKENRLVAYYAIPDYGWGVIAKESVDTAFANRNSNLRFILAVYSIIFLLNLFLAYLVIRSLAQRKNAEEKLRLNVQSLKESEEQIRTLFRNAPDAVIVINQEGKIVQWNPKTESTFGWTKEEVMGKHLYQTIIPERYREAHIKGMERFLKTGEGPVLNKTIEISALRKDNIEIDVALSISASVVKGNYIFIAFIRDITEHKRLEQEIQQSQIFLNSIVENIPNMLFVKDARELRFIRFNKVGEELIGYTREELMGKNDYDFFPKEQADFFTERDRAVLKEGKFIDIPEEQINTKNKGLRILHTKKLPIFNQEGEPQYLLGISEDITEQKAAEQALKQAKEELEKNIAELEALNHELESFSYSVSHDLRAPIRAIDGFARILEEEYAEQLGEEGKRLFGVIRSNTHKMGQLIDDLLAFSRLGRKPLEKYKIDMNSLVNTIIEEQKYTERDRKVNIKIGELGTVYGDNSMIKQVLYNLISNAIKFTGKKEAAQIEIGSYKENNEIVFYIKDNGVGFDMQYSHKLFGVFQRLHNEEEFEGTGVGLAIVQKVINRHGGRVWAEGKVNEGATFYFSLPIDEP